MNWKAKAEKLKNGGWDTLDIVVGVVFFFVPISGNQIYTVVKYLCIAYLLTKYIRTFSHMRLTGAFLGSFTVVLAVSTGINTEKPTWVLSSIMFCAQIASVVALFVSLVQVHGSRWVLKRVFVVVGGFVALTDILVLILPYDRTDSDTQYLIGNKFIVSYAHCLVLGIAYTLLESKRRVIMLFAGVVSAFFSYWVGCTTGALMCVTMAVLLLLPEKMLACISNPFAIGIVLLAINVLIWSPIDIFGSQWFKDILVNVFHKAPTLTGREQLYNVTLSLVADKPLLGYGYLTDIYREVIGYGNAQNGVFHIVTQSGIIGALLYFGGLATALMRKVDTEGSLSWKTIGTITTGFVFKGDPSSFGLYAYLYAMVLGSAVEINLSMQFAYGVALLCAMNAEKGKAGEHTSLPASEYNTGTSEI